MGKCVSVHTSNRLRMLVFLSLWVFFGIVLWHGSVGAHATEPNEDANDVTNTPVSELMEQWRSKMGSEWSNLDDVVEGVSFSQLVQSLLQNPSGNWWESIGSGVLATVREQWQIEKSRLLQLLFLGILSAFFVDFNDKTLKKYVGEVGYFAIYTIMLTLLFVAFESVYQLALSATSAMFRVSGAIVPVFTGGLLLSGNTRMALGNYTLISGGISVVEWISLTFLFPAVYFHFVLQMLNFSMKEDRFSRLTQFIKNVVVWIFRLQFGVIVGMQVVQCLLLPASDRVKNSNFSKSLAAIPGLGASARALTNTLFQSANVLKNSIGVAAMILLFCCVLAPMLKLLITIWTYQLLAALLQPIANRRVAAILSAVAGSAKLLFQGVVTCTALFVVNLVVVTAATNAAVG